MHNSLLTQVTPMYAPTTDPDALVKDFAECLRDPGHFEDHVKTVSLAREILSEMVRTKSVANRTIMGHFETLKAPYDAAKEGIDTSMLPTTRAVAFADVHRGCAARLLGVMPQADQIEEWARQNGLRISY